MATKKKTRRPVRKSSPKTTQRRQPVVHVHRWFNPFHHHVHANLGRWLLITTAMLILILASTVFD